MISLWRASYCSCEISPLASAVFACSAAVFKVASFSLVSSTACPRSLCFCASSSVLPGSSFRSFSMSRSCDCVFLISEFTLLRAFCSFVVSPPISTVMPLILLAPMLPTSSKQALKKEHHCPIYEKSTDISADALCNITFF